MHMIDYNRRNKYVPFDIIAEAVSEHYRLTGDDANGLFDYFTRTILC